MSYQVLARKWRPRNFAEMVGQEHVLRALINALDHDRLHHAFLFTGTRGVGKTTIARILAKSLNCEQGVSSSPCGECSACREIDEGRFVDLIEVDAASRTKVEDTRELLENVQYAPTRGRYKVYLIDEVHMLSDHSFNALLKTLEEPPPHVKFLLATTDPQKLPITILSRCLQFNLKRLPIKLIADHLADVLTRETIDYELAAVQEIARAADGSMRDALSLMDQAIAHGGGKIAEIEVREMLGTIERGHVFALLRALADGNGQTALELVQALSDQAPDFAGVLSELISLLHRVALAQAVPEAVDDSFGDRDEVLALAQKISQEDVQLYYQIGLLGRRDLPLAPDPRGGLEMVLLRMLAFRPTQSAVTERVRSGGGTGGSARPVSPPATAGQAAATVQRRASAIQESAPVTSPLPPAAAATAGTDWPAIVEALGLKAAAQALAVNCVLEKREGDKVYLVLDPAFEQICTDNAKQRLQQALQDYFNEPVKVEIRTERPDAETPAKRRSRLQEERQQEAVRAIENDSVVQDIRETFNAELRPDLIQPVD